MLEIGYTYEQIIRMGKNFPNIFCYSNECLKQKISDIVSLGFKYQDVIRMTSSCPAVIGYSIDNMKKKIDDMVDLGYSREIVIEMIKALPSLFGLSIDTIREKKEFYDSIWLPKIMTEKTPMIMQGNDLSYARYMFYKSRGIEITMDNYLMLFMVQSRFKKKYGISNKELILMFGKRDSVKKKIKEKK